MLYHRPGNLRNRNLRSQRLDFCKTEVLEILRTEDSKRSKAKKLHTLKSGKPETHKIRKKKRSEN